MKPTVSVSISSAVKGLRVGLVEVDDVTIGPASESLQRWCKERSDRVIQAGAEGGDERREGVRAMLRAGGFKPSGRNKPAQEYLLRTVAEGQALPAILNAVDVINAVSLQSGLPISLLAADRMTSLGTIRYGCAGERFVFNRSGQELDVEGLICVCAGDSESVTPLGTPIKDSMLGKVTDGDRHLLAIIYAPAKTVTDGELTRWTQELAGAFAAYCGGHVVQTAVIE